MSNARVRRDEAERILGMEARMAYLGELASKSQYDEYCKFIDGKVHRLSPKLNSRLAASVLELSDVFLLRALTLDAIDNLACEVKGLANSGRRAAVSLELSRFQDLHQLLQLLEEEGWIRWYTGEAVEAPNWQIR